MDFFSVQISEIMTNWSEGFATLLNSGFFCNFCSVSNMCRGNTRVYVARFVGLPLIYNYSSGQGFKDTTICRQISKVHQAQVLLWQCIHCTYTCPDSHTLNHLTALPFPSTLQLSYSVRRPFSLTGPPGDFWLTAPVSLINKRLRL